LFFASVYFTLQALTAIPFCGFFLPPFILGKSGLKKGLPVREGALSAILALSASK